MGERVPLKVTGVRGPSLTLWLSQIPPSGTPRNKAVLLVPGANSRSMTFTIPDGGFARYLAERGWDVWLLDWRGSPLVVDPLVEDPHSLCGTLMDEIRAFTLDEAAKDVAYAVGEVRNRIRSTPLSLLSHCVGAGITSIAIALGLLAQFDLSRVVLSNLGLFYEVPWDGWVKAEDFILERVLESKTHRAVDPHLRTKWPDEMEKAYARWPKAWQVKPGDRRYELLNRLSFMVGRPWEPECIDERIDEAVLRKVFGNLHLGLYLHCGQMVRRGYAAPFDYPDIIDRSRLTHRRSDPGVQGYLVPDHFRNMNLTLVTAAKNRVWHRDSMDLMFEWLQREARGGRFEKLVFHDYGLQEIFWARNGRQDAYRELEKVLK